MNALVPIEHHTVFSPRAQAAFLDNLSHSGNVRLACRAASVSPQTAYRARRRSPALALAWDAALLAARAVAEEVLASRALDGVEEPVFYHGEEVAVRRRYSDRLLLAHLARLDKLAEREDAGAALAELDEAIEALRRGEELEVVPTLRQAQGERTLASKSAQHERGRDERGDCCASEGQAGSKGGRNFSDMDPVPCVPPCKNCGGRCDDPEAELTEADCMWFGNRRDRMNAARPHDALPPWRLPTGDPDGAIEWAQLLAFEAGEDEWWLVTPESCAPSSSLR